MIKIIKRLINCMIYSLDGLAHAWRTEPSFRYEAVLLPLAVLLLIIIRPGPVWTAILLAGHFVLMGLELFNSAIETAFNMISPDYHIMVKRGKDMASAGILMAICGLVLCWLAMLYDCFLA